MAEKKVVQVGKKLKDFRLKDHNGKDFILAHCKGKRVLLSFHPLAWTPVCSKQMKALEKRRAAFQQHNAVAFGVSVDPSPSKLAWARELGMKETRLLSDFWPHGAVAQAFGIFREKDGFSERAVIVLDEKRKVCFVKVYPLPELPDLDEVLRALEGMGD